MSAATVDDVVAPLAILSAEAFAAAGEPGPGDPDQKFGLLLMLNRLPTEREVEMYQRLPALPKMVADMQSAVGRMETAELVVRLFKLYVLGLIMPDQQAALEHLREYLDQPLGTPMKWPGMVATMSSVLTRWGFAPTDAGYVGRSVQKR